MVQVSICSTSIIVSRSTTETVPGTLSPWKLEFTAMASPPWGETAIVEGKRPRDTTPATVSAPISYLTNEPNGNPWPKVRYQWPPAGSTKTPWGDSISAGHHPTATTFSLVSPAPGVNRKTATSSSDSDATYMR